MTDKSMAIERALHFEPLTELALKRYNIKASGEGIRFEEHSAEAVKDLDFLIALMEFYSDPDERHLPEFEAYSISVILDYLKKTHRFYIDELLPKIEMSVWAMTGLFPQTNSALLLEYFYRTYQNELLEHIELEERLLFPYAERLYDGIWTSEYSISAFRKQHDHQVVDQLEEIIRVIDENNDEVTRSFAYRTFRHLVDQFRNDLNIHHLIEERVLLKKLETLEASLQQS